MNLKPLNQDEFSMKIIEDLGMLYPTENSKQKKRTAIFECSYCKKKFKATINAVKRNNQSRCYRCTQISHNDTGTKLYRTWSHIKDRCLNEKDCNYKYYGKRGIEICDEWRNNYIAFKEWALKNGYSDDLTIDRIDNDKNYCPDNCRWVNKQIQAANRRKNSNNKSGYIGVSFDKKRNLYVSEIRVNKKKIHLGRYKTAKEAAIVRNNYIDKNELFQYTKNKI